MLKVFLALFWNSNQRRLRALWRLGLQTLAMVVLLGLSQLVPAGFARLGFQDNRPALAASVLASAAAITLSVALAGRLLDRRPFAHFGLRFSPAWWGDFAFGLALGAGLMALIFLVERAAGWVSVAGYFNSGGHSFAGVIWLPALAYICVGIQEELAARGYLLRNLAEGLNFKPLGPRRALLAAYLLSSLIFGFLHAANPNATLLSSLLVACAGLFLGLGFILTGELAIPIGLHIAWNFFQGNVFGFPVSGTSAGPSVIAIRQAGPVWATGGAFGPEAGVIGLGAVLLGCLLTLAWLRLRRGSLSLHAPLAEYNPVHGKQNDPV